MFTGIIEEIGTVEQIRKGAHSAGLTIRAADILKDAGIGDSIAVNGICLTVTELLPGRFTADVMHETLNRSSLAQLKCGSHVNLERAIPAAGRFGGHFVAGHVDGTGKIIGIRRDDTAVWYKIQTAPDIMRYLVEKGSVAVDGISLTVAAVTPEDFSVSVIPHTLSCTVLKERCPGDTVNLETDLIGKYIERLCLAPRQPQYHTQRKESVITENFLSENGF